MRTCVGEAESFSKNKHVVKEKFGIRVEKYKDVKSEPHVSETIPALMKNPASAL